jgi:hypothetical protein
MSVYVTWTRVEPDHHATDPRAGARCPVADPFWSLGRQWWIGELEGFDGGSPVASSVEFSAIPLFGSVDEARDTVLSSGLAAPVAEPGRRLEGDWRVAYALGRSAARELASRADGLRQRSLVDLVDIPRDGPRLGLDDPSGRLRRRRIGIGGMGGVGIGASDTAELRKLEQAASRLASDFPLEVPAILDARIPVGERIDGVALLVALRRGGDRVAELGPYLAAWAAARADVLIGADADTFAVETGRHSLEIDVEGGRMHTETARGPALHWSDMSVEIGSRAETEMQQPVPVRLSFEGAPPIRWWGIEDVAVDYVAAPAGPSDLGQLLIAASFQEQGGIYWQLPIDIPGNCLLRIASVEVRDGFGVRRTSTSMEGDALQGWKSCRAADLQQDTTTDWMLILNEPDPLRGEPIEEVSLVADEIDNLIWMIEDIVPGPLGRGVRISQPSPRPVPSQEEYTPRLAPPDAWIAYQQVAPDRLERAVLAPLATRRERRTQFTREALKMTPGMLGAGGLRLQRQWSLARSASGRRIVWQCRRSLADLPRGSSGLLHDQIVKPEA